MLHKHKTECLWMNINELVLLAVCKSNNFWCMSCVGSKWLYPNDRECLQTPCAALTPFFSADDLQYTFGVRSLHEVPTHTEFYPRLYRDDDGRPIALSIDLDGDSHRFELSPSGKDLLARRVTVVHRESEHGGGRLEYTRDVDLDDCHFQFVSNSSYGAVSTCDGELVS